MSFEKVNEDAKQITYDKIRIGLASPEKIREWARAGRTGDVTEYEVKKPETIKKKGTPCRVTHGMNAFLSPKPRWIKTMRRAQYARMRFKNR